MSRFKVLPAPIHHGDDGFVIKSTDRDCLAVAARPVGHFHTRREFQKVTDIPRHGIAGRIGVHIGGHGRHLERGLWATGRIYGHGIKRGGWRFPRLLRQRNGREKCT